MHRIIGLTKKIESFTSKSKLLYWIASRYYRNVVKKEINLANITKKDHILCIGGGICPISAILFHQATGAKVTVIDNCKMCVGEAQQVIDRLALGEYVHAVWQDGGNIDFSLSDFSVVHFALQVSPMEYVFPKVKNKAAYGTKILVRRPKKYLNSMYSKLTGSLLACCNYITHQKACNIGSTLLYIKQEHLNEEKVPGLRHHCPVGTRAADTAVAFPCNVAV